VQTDTLPINVLSQRNRVNGRGVIIALLSGILIAQCGTVVLCYSYLWASLFVVGMIVAVFSLAAKSFKEYWLMVFVLALPLDIKKMLIDSDIIRELAQLHGIPTGELPGPVVYLTDLPFMVLLAMWLLEIVVKKQKVFFPKGNIYAVAFVAWAGLSLVNATVFSYGFFDLLRTGKFYLLYLYIANNVDSMSVLKTVVKYLLIGMVIQGGICLYQYMSQDISAVFGNLFGKQDLYSEESIDKFKEFFAVTPGSEQKRASGTAGPINAQAQYFEFLLPVAFLLSLGSVKYQRSILSWLSLGFGTLGLLVTFSRGAFVGMAIGTAGIFLLARRMHMISKEKYRAVIVAVLLAGVLLAPSIYSFIMARHEATVARFHLYKVGLDMIRDHPLLGVGLNNHVVEAPNYDPDVYIFPTPTHNQYLLTASEVGIPGLVFIFVFLYSTIVIALRNARSNLVFPAVVSLGIVGAFVAIGTHSVVDHLSYHTNLTLVWLFAGLVPALGRIEAHEAKYIGSTVDENPAG
jgi:hypothetical protein